MTETEPKLMKYCGNSIISQNFIENSMELNMILTRIDDIIT